jgi:exonuclease SbcC
MFKKLIVQNFQRHKKKTIKFGRYVTTITGRNDAGKSAIIRALRWLCANKPNGKGFIRHGQKQASVTLQCGKSTIRRTAGRNNSYVLDKKVFKAFRSDVPPEIAKVLKVDEINFAKQHDPTFWFSLTPGQVAKELNKLVDLETIDRIQAAVAKRLRDKKAELQVSQQRLESARQAKKQLAWVPTAHQMLARLESVNASISAKSTTRAAFALLLSQAQNHASTVRDVLRPIVAAQNGARIAAKALAARNRAKALKSLCGAIRRSQQALTGTIPKPPKPPPNQKRINKLRSVISSIRKHKSSLIKTNKKLKKKQKLLEKKLGGRCPTCGTILSNGSLI